MKIVKPEELPALEGTEIHVSDWFALDQDRITNFAETTEDRYFIHTDPEKAKETPLGGTIAHGLLTLSMLPRLSQDKHIVIEGFKMFLNYGFDKVRFIAPVASGKRVRGRFTLKDGRERMPGQWMFRYDVTVEIEGEDRPALSAEWLLMQMT